MAGDTREASVKLTLDSGQYMVELRKVGDSVDDAQKKATKSAGLWGAGISKVGQNFATVAGHLKSVVGLAAALGGGLSIGVAIKGAETLRMKYRDVAFALELASGKSTDFADVQRVVEAAAADTKLPLAALAAAYDMLAGSVNKDFGDAQLRRVSVTARATGASVEGLSKLAVVLHQKFGVAGEEMEGALAESLHTMNAAGLSLDQFAMNLEASGASALALGMSGQRGLNLMLHALEKVRPLVKDAGEAAGGVKATFERLGSDKFFETLEKASRTKLNLTGSEDLSGRIRAVLAAGEKARDELFKLFPQRETMAVLSTFTQPFTDEFERATEAGMGAKDATAAALRAYDRSLEESAAATTSFAKFQDQAARNLEDPQAKYEQAMNELTMAFQQPEMVEAIHTVAEVMPKLAEMLANTLSFAAQNPILAGMLGISATAGISFVQGAATAFVKRAFEASAAANAGRAFAGAAFGPIAMLAAGAVIAAAIGSAIQDKVEGADAARRKRAADKLRAELSDEFKRTGKQRALTESERLVLKEGGAPGEEVPTGTDLGKDRAKFQRDQARRAELKALGVDLGPGAEQEDVVRVGALGARNLADAGLIPGEKKGEAGEVRQIVTTGSAAIAAPKADLGNLPQRESATPAQVKVDTASFAESLRRNILRVEVVNPPGSASTRGAPKLPAPAPAPER